MRTDRLAAGIFVALLLVLPAVLSPFYVTLLNYIGLYALVPDARHIAVGPQGVVTFVGTRKNTVWAVTNRNSGDTATEVKPFAPSAKFHVPNGVCWTKDGFLVVVEHNRVLNFPAAEFFYEGGDVAVIETVPQGGLIPPEEESYNHGSRVCKMGPDGLLYVSVLIGVSVPLFNVAAVWPMSRGSGQPFSTGATLHRVARLVRIEERALHPVVEGAHRRAAPDLIVHRARRLARGEDTAGLRILE